VSAPAAYPHDEQRTLLLLWRRRCLGSLSRCSRRRCGRRRFVSARQFPIIQTLHVVLFFRQHAQPPLFCISRAHWLFLLLLAKDDRALTAQVMLLQRVAALDARAVRQLRRRQRAQVEPSACLPRLIENLLRFGVEVAVPAARVRGQPGTGRKRVTSARGGVSVVQGWRTC
jgi:hypothetical protein